MLNESQGRAVATVTTTAITGVSALAFHGGPWGIALALGTGILTWGFGDVGYKATRALIMSEELEIMRDAIKMNTPSVEDLHPDQGTFSKIKRLAGLKTVTSPKEASVEEARQSVIPLGSAKVTKEPARISIEQIVKSTEKNSFKVCIGRSLTKEGNPPVQVGFYKQHFKFIGASQRGKSAMVAAFLDIVTRTHDEDHVLIALLDLEDQTSKLFADLPHIAEVDTPNGPVLLHARSHEEVLHRLRLIMLIMNERYAMSKSQILQEPILLVYVEEFLALKDHFKNLISAKSGDEKKQAEKDYADLIFCISEIARRGLKVRIQLLLCAQVNYRDDDLQEALVNIVAGMSFAVLPTAAQAAGFYDSGMLKQCARNDRVGEAVTQTPDCKDLVLAPEYDLEQKLIDLERASAIPGQKKTDSILGARNGRKNTSSSQSSNVFRPSNVNFLEDATEEAWEAGGSSGRSLEEKSGSNPFELKRLLADIGKMKAEGMSHDAILKQYGLNPGGRNNQNLKAVTEVIAELSSEEA